MPDLSQSFMANDVMTIGVLEPGLDTVALGVLIRELVDTVGLFEAIFGLVILNQNNELQQLVVGPHR